MSSVGRIASAGDDGSPPRSIQQRPPCRLYVILARKAPVGIIFRRGPTKWVQLIKWYTESDAFEQGQWFRGRIYERRCDLSPDGRLLIYFASKFNRRTKRDLESAYAWTAISKPPYLTALALWPKGDCWHGGGIFESPQRVWLNHKPERAVPHPQHMPQGLDIVANPDAAGEDYPVWRRRMLLGGWTCLQTGEYEFWPENLNFRTRRVESWQKDAPGQACTLVYQLKAINIGARLGGALVESHTLRWPNHDDIILRGVGWADWDHSGRLVFVRAGSLFVGAVEDGKLSASELAHFDGNTPRPLEAPEWAKHW